MDKFKSFTSELIKDNYKMKKISLLTLLVLLSPITHAADPSNLPFEATGKITQNSCQMALSQEVVINAVSFDKMHDAAYVKSKGADSNATLLVINATECSPGTVSASIIGTADANDPELLGITQGDGYAKHVGIAFISAQNNAIVAPNTGTATQTGGTESQHNFEFQINPVKETNSTAEPGKIKATAQIHINYL